MKPKKMNSLDIVLYFITLFLLTYFVVVLSNTYDSIAYANVNEKKKEEVNFIHLITETISNFENPNYQMHISTNTSKFLLGECFICFLYVSYKMTTRKKMLPGKEYGSGHWENPKRIARLIDSNFFKNMILTQTEFLSMNGKKTRRNMNIMVIGGSGSGKTRFFLKPNLVQLHSSFVLTDPKGEILLSCGKMLQDAGFKIRVLNLIEMGQSSGYNPFHYLRPNRDEDVMTLINTIMMNTKGSQESSSADPFWEKAEMLFLQSLFYYLVYEAPAGEQHIPMIMELIRMADIKEEDEEAESDLDILFQLLEEEKGSEHIAVVQYKHFKVAAGKTAKSIVISASARLAPYNIPALKEISMQDELSLNTLGEEKTALFVIVSPTNTTYNFVASMMYTQLFAETDYVANWKYNGSVPVPIRLLLDEFANIGKIPNFEKILSYARSLNMGIVPIFQSLSQLKEMYEKSWETLLDNCDYFLFLGGQGTGTLEYISKKLGKMTLDIHTNSKQMGRQRSHTTNYNKNGRELLTPQEIGEMPMDECILFMKGFAPFYSKKFDITKHKNYKLLADSNIQNTYVYNPNVIRIKNKLNGLFMDSNQIIQKWKLIQNELCRYLKVSKKEQCTSVSNDQVKDHESSKNVHGEHFKHIKNTNFKEYSEHDYLDSNFEDFSVDTLIEGKLLDFKGLDIELSYHAKNYKKVSVAEDGTVSIHIPNHAEQIYIKVPQQDSFYNIVMTVDEFRELLKEDSRVLNTYDLDEIFKLFNKVKENLSFLMHEITYFKDLLHEDKSVHGEHFLTQLNRCNQTLNPFKENFQQNVILLKSILTSSKQLSSQKEIRLEIESLEKALCEPDDKEKELSILARHVLNELDELIIKNYDFLQESGLELISIQNNVDSTNFDLVEDSKTFVTEEARKVAQELKCIITEITTENENSTTLDISNEISSIPHSQEPEPIILDTETGDVDITSFYDEFLNCDFSNLD